jgi:molybdopterin-containing oxidoreductase family iron-sulfur binding subunit
MEFPDPVTRITWENYLNISVEMAKNLKIKEGEIVEVEVNGAKVKVPAHIQPGLHSKTVALAVGFGRSDAGSVGSHFGANAYQLVQYKNGMPVFSALGVKVTPTGSKADLATVQEHHSMEGRHIIIQATLKDYLKNPAANIESGSSLSLWPKHEYKGYRWAMVIDQNACNGCGACVVACQSENNIPTVGKKYVLKGRAMHWLRIDRYYTGHEGAPETTTFQPVLCQQCENAPCETVCPVLATVHDDEGLNQMTYNRCVGTRYCSNNCPYKVRRFNWFNYEAGLKKPQTMALNPDVTIRSRGVMEKCTFCVQRLHEAKNIAKDKGTTVKDGDVQTACQESCPTNAIVFGNFNDGTSEVVKEFKNPRSYALLEDLNTVPMVRYQTRIKNIDKTSANEEGASHE